MYNDGYADVPDTIVFTLYVDNIPIRSWNLPGLWVNGSVITEDYPYDFNFVPSIVSIKADPDDYWEELSEGDNEYDLSVTGIYDDSIPPVCELINPNGGFDTTVCSPLNIEWTASDQGSGIYHQAVYYSANGGSNWILITDTLSPASRSFTWTIPCTLAMTSQAKLRIMVADHVGHTAADESDTTFTIISDRLPEPINFHGDVSQDYRHVTLTWIDRPFNSGYEIVREDEEGNSVTFTLNDSNATSYTDYQVTPFHTYKYSIRAIDNNGHYSHWVVDTVLNSPILYVAGLEDFQLLYLRTKREYILTVLDSFSGETYHKNCVIILPHFQPRI